MAWDRQLWGVEFIDSWPDDPPMLIGDAWCDPRPISQRDGEPTRALLFTTRKIAREWCEAKMRGWREGSSANDVTAKWRVRPVRVRETVRRVEPKPRARRKK